MFAKPCPYNTDQPDPEPTHRTSLVYSILLHLTERTRAERIPSLRRVLGQYGRQNYHCRRNSGGDSSISSDGSITPPPSYKSSTSDGEELSALCPLSPSQPRRFATDMAEPGPIRTTALSSNGLIPFRTDESKSGVSWKHANEACTLVGRSVQEATSSAQDIELTRQLYIDGMAYFLRGLPSDLTVDEAIRLRAALPPQLNNSVQQSGTRLASGSPPPTARKEQSAKTTPSLLQRAVTCITLQIIITIAFLLPYIQLLFGQAYRYDRKFRISDRVLAKSVAIADSMGKQTIALAGTVCAMNEGKVGDALREMSVWAVQGVTAGVYEGVGEGMRVVGLRVDDAKEPLASDRVGGDDSS